jgi:hypothetical protein
MEKMSFKERVKRTLARMVNEKVEKVDLAAIFKYGYFDSLTYMYSFRKLLKDLGLIDDDGRLDLEKAKKFLIEGG